MHLVYGEGEANTRVRIRKSNRTADAVMAEGAWIRAHVHGLRRIQQYPERLMVRPLLHQLGNVVLLGDHGFDRRGRSHPHTVQFTATRERAVYPRHTSRVAVTVAACDFA